MSAYMQSALRYRVTMPAWLLTTAIAVAIAIAIFAAALLGGSSGQPSPAAADAAPAQSLRATPPSPAGGCLDTRVGHC